MLALSGPIIIGKIEVDHYQIVIRKDEDLAVKDFLYLLDYYAGNQWALDLIRVETRKELGLDT